MSSVLLSHLFEWTADANKSCSPADPLSMAYVLCDVVFQPHPLSMFFSAVLSKKRHSLEVTQTGAASHQHGTRDLQCLVHMAASVVKRLLWLWHVSLQLSGFLAHYVTRLHCLLLCLSLGMGLQMVPGL